MVRRDKALCDRKRRINRIADVVLVFDLRLRQRGFFDDAPHHRLRAAIKEPVLDELEYFAGDLGFGWIAHRQVRMIPVADDAEPLELLALHRNPMFRIGAAFPAESHDGVRI